MQNPNTENSKHSFWLIVDLIAIWKLVTHFIWIERIKRYFVQLDECWRYSMQCNASYFDSYKMKYIAVPNAKREIGRIRRESCISDSLTDYFCVSLLNFFLQCETSTLLIWMSLHFHKNAVKKLQAFQVGVTSKKRNFLFKCGWQLYSHSIRTVHRMSLKKLLQEKTSISQWTKYC